jgi:predicted nuclease of predicted toxin-antitoxin system
LICPQTSDTEICAIAESDERIVVTKDADFVHSYIFYRRPPRLLLISTGNISNDELAALLLPALPLIATAFESALFVELNRTGLITHS